MTIADLPPATLTEELVDIAPLRRFESQATEADPGLSRLRMTVPWQAASSSWFQGVKAQLADYFALSPGWDSYRGRPTAAHAAESALTFLVKVARRDTHAPAVVPLADGGLQLIWHRGGLDVEATFPAEAPEDRELYVRDIRTGEEFELDPFDSYAIDHSLGERLARLSS